MAYPTRIFGVLVGIFLFAGALIAAPAGAVSTFVVTNTNDTGGGSLRDAIDLANANTLTLDVIAFAIAGTTLHTITPATVLPGIAGPTVIDGYTQPGSSKNTLASGSDAVITIEIDGSSVANQRGITFDTGSAGSVLRGVAINGFSSGGQGVRFQSNASTGYRVEGCFIGTNAAGSSADPNSTGIAATSGSSITIGGPDAGQRNIIAGNGDGIRIDGSATVNNVIQGNLIGLKDSGAPLSNTGDAITVVGASTGNRILDNAISSSVAGLGIDLTDDGVTTNDVRDRDDGANRLQNFPVITRVTRDTDGSTRIAGRLSSTPRRLFTIQFFANEAGDEADGEIPLGQLNIRTNRFGAAAFAFITTAPTAADQTITATATNFSTKDTSEFSAPFTAPPA
jgi:trimeric autotransporter adhesin